MDRGRRGMAQGRLVACGAPAEICTAPLLFELYGRPVNVMQRPGTDELLILPTR
jgi:iron complex transport system ATP-binding protein